jgi:hypothetical protein
MGRATPTTPDGLTPKQLGFARDLAKDGNASQAYRRNYDVAGMATTTIGHEAHLLAHNPKVAAHVQRIHRRTAVYADLDASLIATNLLEDRRIAQDGSNPASMVAADRALGEMIGVLGVRRHVVEGTIRHEHLHASLGELDADALRALVALGELAKAGKVPALPAATSEDAPGEQAAEKGKRR